MLLELNSETHSNHVVFKNGKKLTYTVMLRAIYGMLVAALLFYKNFCGDLENIGFDFNPCGPHVTNRIKFGKQHTVIFHVDYVMPNRVKPKVDYKFK